METLVYNLRSLLISTPIYYIQSFATLLYFILFWLVTRILYLLEKTFISVNHSEAQSTFKPPPTITKKSDTTSLFVTGNNFYEATTFRNIYSPTANQINDPLVFLPDTHLPCYNINVKVHIYGQVLCTSDLNQPFLAN